MALMACQAQYWAVTQSRGAAVSASSRRAVSPPSAFFATGFGSHVLERTSAGQMYCMCTCAGGEVHASCSSITFSEGRSALAVAPRPVVASRQRKSPFVVRGLFGLGVPELAVIAGVAALLFGPKQLPQLGKQLGQSVKSFQQAAKEFESEVKGDSEEPKASGGVSGDKEKIETITPTPVATPSGTENKSS